MYIYFYFYKEELLYIGSTFDFKQREGTHKSRLKCNSNLQFYKYLREQNLTLENLEAEVVKTEITDNTELRRLEGNLIKIYNPICNKEVAGRTHKEYYEDNKDKYKEYQKEYREDNKDKISEYKKVNKDKISHNKKEYNKVNKDKISQYYKDNKDKKSEYQKVNKDKISEYQKEYQKEYYEKNKAKLIESQRKRRAAKNDEET